MKKLPLILSILALAGVIALAIVNFTKGSKKPAAVETSDAAALKGEIVYFECRHNILHRVTQSYRCANGLHQLADAETVVQLCAEHYMTNLLQIHLAEYVACWVEHRKNV